MFTKFFQGEGRWKVILGKEGMELKPKVLGEGRVEEFKRTVKKMGLGRRTEGGVY